MSKKGLPQMLAALLPSFIREWVRLFYLLHKVKGRLRWNSEVSSWVVDRPMGGKRPMSVIVRSFKEFRRIVQFGSNKEDIVYKWLHGIKNCENLYDIGSASGLEGFLCHNLHDSKVCFVEPFTASIETIMRNVYLVAKQGADPTRLEVVHAGCDKDSHYDKAYMMCVPKAGETQISFADPASYERRGRVFAPITTQWVFGVSIDDMHFKYKLDLPSHVKIDVDGFEHRVIEGAAKTLESGAVESWAIEITGDHNLDYFDQTMKKYGYVEIARWEHYPGLPARTFDIIYSKASAVTHYKNMFGINI